MCRYLLRTKNPQQLRARVHDMSARRAPDNIIKAGLPVVLVPAQLLTVSRMFYLPIDATLTLHIPVLLSAQDSARAFGVQQSDARRRVPCSGERGNHPSHLASGTNADYW